MYGNLGNQDAQRPPVIHASSPVSSRVAHLLQSGGLDQPASNSVKTSSAYSRQRFTTVQVCISKWFPLVSLTLKG